MNIRTFMNIFAIGLFTVSLNSAAAVLTLSFSPSQTTVTLANDATLNWNASGGNSTNCPTTTPYTFSLDASPARGTVTLNPSFANNGIFSYSNDGAGSGYLSTSTEIITISVACGADTPASQDIQVSAIPTVSCTGDNVTGVVILDNTATPGQASIASNLAFLDGCGKSDTTIDDGFGGNAINIKNFQTVNRDNSVVPHLLDLVIGNSATTVDDNNFATDKQLYFFADGQHLFDLDRLRAVADWLSTSGNVTPVDTTVTPVGTYGTITYEQFLDNVANARTMYGMVRVKIGLVQGQRSECKGNCNKSAVGLDTIDPTTIYGFCNSKDGSVVTTAGLCSCAPDSKTNLQDGDAYCGHNITSSSRIKVKGSLLWDFVDYDTEDPIPLSQLPFAPRELYFKVTVPINVNGDHDTTPDDGAMDNMYIIKAVTNGLANGPVTPSPAINFSDIPQSSKDYYLYATGTTLDATEFATLNEPNKYHLLMASGYADGWAEAFEKLDITATTWSSIPTATECANYPLSTSCTSTLGVPSGVTGVMVANDVRDSGFEDLPTYLYSGGLIDMHGHVNISGLLYVPQAMELEAKDDSVSNPTRQYVSGAILVRDGFYIEADNNTITVISSDPNSYSTARTNTTVSTTSSLSFNDGGPGSDSSGPPPPSPPPGTPPGDDKCIGCSDVSGGGGGSGGGGAGVGDSRWTEVRPN